MHDVQWLRICIILMSRNVQEKYLGTLPCIIYIYRTLQFMVFFKVKQLKQDIKSSCNPHVV